MTKKVVTKLEPEMIEARPAETDVSFIIWVQGGQLRGDTLDRLHDWLVNGHGTTLCLELPMGMSLHIEAIGKGAKEAVERAERAEVHVYQRSTLEALRDWAAEAPTGMLPSRWQKILDSVSDDSTPGDQ